MVEQDFPYADGDVKLTGVLVHDDAARGQRPGILVFPEVLGVGEHVKRRARALAELGFVALVADPYGRTFAESDEAIGAMNALKVSTEGFRRRLGAAVDALAAHKLVDARRVGAIGYCFGGACVLELARAGAAVKSVVSFHGELSPGPINAGGVHTKILICAGAEDIIAPEEARNAIGRELTAAKADWQLIVYGGAKHAFTMSEVDAMGSEMFRYQPEADRRSWRAMQEWFSETL